MICTSAVCSVKFAVSGLNVRSGLKDMDTSFRHRSDHLSSCDRVVHRTIVCSDKRVGTVQTCSIHVFGCRRGLGLPKSRNHQPNLMENGWWMERERNARIEKQETDSRRVGRDVIQVLCIQSCTPRSSATYFEMNSALTVLTTLSRTDTLYVGSQCVLSRLESHTKLNSAFEQGSVQVPIHAHSLGNICQEALVRPFLKR